MWFVVRIGLLVVTLASLSWGLFFVDLGDRPLAQHLKEVYQSPEVQKRIDTIGGQLAAKAAKEVKGKAVAETSKRTRQLAATARGQQPAQASSGTAQPQRRSEDAAAPSRETITAEETRELESLLQ